MDQPIQNSEVIQNLPYTGDLTLEEFAGEIIS